MVDSEHLDGDDGVSEDGPEEGYSPSNTRLKNGKLVNRKQAMDWMMSLLHDFFDPAKDGEKFLADLWSFCQKEGKTIPQEFLSIDDNHEYADPFTHTVAEVPKQLLLSAVSWRDGRLALGCPFVEVNALELYVRNLELLASRNEFQHFFTEEGRDAMAAAATLESVANAVFIREESSKPAHRLEVARVADFESGAMTILTTGVKVPTNTATEIMIDLGIPSGDHASTVEDLWRFCRGDKDLRDDVLYRQELNKRGLIDVDNKPDPVLQAVLAAAVRWEGPNLIVVSPFTDAKVQQDYLDRCRSIGHIIEAHAPPEGARLTATPPQAGRGR